MFSFSHLRLHFLNYLKFHVYLFCYLSSKNEQTICFHYGVELESLEPSDIPWVEHAKWAPTCIYVIHIRGLPLVQNCQRLQPAEKY
jgi:hypothetical protein